MNIKIDDLQKVEIRLGHIVLAEKVEGSQKLLRLKIDLGEDRPRIILSGIAKAYPDPSYLIGRYVPIVSNLEARKMMGEVSEGMMLCAIDNDGAPVILNPEKNVSPGSMVR